MNTNRVLHVWGHIVVLKWLGKNSVIITIHIKLCVVCIKFLGCQIFNIFKISFQGSPAFPFKDFMSVL